MDLKYHITVVNSPMGLADLIKIAGEGTYHEYDCDRDTYLNHIISNIYPSNQYRSVLLWAGAEVVGYLISRRDTHLYNQVEVVDVQIKKEHRGRSLIQIMIDDLGAAAFESGAKRIVWRSHVFGKEFWEKHSFSLPVKQSGVFCVDLAGNKDSFLEASKQHKEALNVRR